jgi:hypothetical protein
MLIGNLERDGTNPVVPFHVPQTHCNVILSVSKWTVWVRFCGCDGPIWC